MYSRFPKNTDRPIRLPDHYSGCAFSEEEEKPPQEAPAPPFHGSEISEPPGEPSPPFFKGEVTSILGKNVNRLLGGLQFEELLLIGLIVLLARTEQESDVILWLALLLFCK